MKTEAKKIVIVGGGFAGLAAAKELKKSNAEVYLIDKANHHLFQPLLYQVATAALSPGEIATPIRTILGKKSTTKVVLAEVTEIDLENKKIEFFKEKSLNYDQLILAPGARYNYFGNDQWAQYSSSLKSIGDALNMREKILLSLEEAEQEADSEERKKLLRYVVIGGGPTGVEIAGAIAEIAKSSMRKNYRNIDEKEVQVLLLEGGPAILGGFPAELRSSGKQMLEELGVKVLCHTPVTKIEKRKVHLRVGSIEAGNIIWAAGIKASPLMDQLKVEKDRMRRVIVNPDLSVPGHRDVFVIGDSAHLSFGEESPLPALASVAMQQGKFVGKLLMQKYEKFESRPHFEYKDKGKMATIGRARAVAEIKGLKFSGFPAWLAWSAAHIFLLIGFRNKILVSMEWIWNYFTRKRGVQLITDRSECELCYTKETDSRLSA